MVLVNAVAEMALVASWLRWPWLLGWVNWSWLLQYGDMSSDDTTVTIHLKKMNLVAGSPPKFDTLLASWHPTYMQSFIISHYSCAEQYGDMSSDDKKKNCVTGSSPRYDTLLASWYPT